MTWSERAVVTIVSANYLARARALCRSLQEHEPSVSRFVLLVEPRSAELLGADEPFLPLWVEDLGIPHLDDFMVQYDVMEANTAVKPYVLAHLFEAYPLERLVYLDPDTLLYAPLTEVWRGLEQGNVVLTPHLRDPYRDEAAPGELEILRSGTYNLGFIGLRRGDTASRLLDWWAGHTERDCVVDLQRGVFVDQRWMDLAPGYFDGVVVLRDPGYNVAYWNLHEREVTHGEDGPLADGRPLAFFHFSGHDVARPWVMSVHQRRHDLRSLPAVKALFDDYAARVRSEGHDAVHAIPWGFCRLKNGIAASPLLRRVMRRLRQGRVAFPSVEDADTFCRFVMTPNAAVCGTEISPFVDALLELRPDLEAAYPLARTDAANAAFQAWLASSLSESEGADLYRRFGSHLAEPCAYDRVLSAHERSPASLAAHPEAFRTGEGFAAFATWLEADGAAELGLGAEEIAEFIHAGRTGFERVVEFFLASPDLHRHFPLALLPNDRGFVEWLVRHGTRDVGFTISQIRWFETRVRHADPNHLLLLTALRNEWVRLRFPLGATTYGWSELAAWARARLAERGTASPDLLPAAPTALSPLAQLEVLEGASGWVTTPGAFRSREALRHFADAAAHATGLPGPGERAAFDAAVRGYARDRGVNVAGYFHYAAGVGNAAHSLARAFEAAAVPCHRLTLPVSPSRMTAGDADPSRVPARFFERHRPGYEVDVIVANADGMRAARAFLGPDYGRGRRRVAYWVWETDSLPGAFADGAEGLERVWTPSEFSAGGIRRTLGDAVPVEVVPYSVAPPTPTAACPVALPEGRVLVGFFFDARSIVERKNPEALLRAFRQAFRADDPVTLVLKVNHGAQAPDVMRRLVAAAEGLPVVWLHDVHLSEVETASLIQRLDVYASLHRSEGFGLVLAEAMALGKAVVATGYSGNVEFMDDTCARLVNHRVITTDRAHAAYPRGTRWAEPDVEHAASLLRALALDEPLRRDLGERARARIQQTLSPAVIARTVLQRLGWAPQPPSGPQNGESHPAPEWTAQRGGTAAKIALA